MRKYLPMVSAFLTLGILMGCGGKKFTGCVGPNDCRPQVPQARLHYDNTTKLDYSDTGQVVNPSTGAVVGNFPLGALVTSNGPIVMMPDGLLGYAYFIGQTPSQKSTPDYTIEAFDLIRFSPVASATLKNIGGTPVKLIPWGANELALLTKTPAPIAGNSTGQGNAVYRISGSFITHPAAAQARSSLSVSALN